MLREKACIKKQRIDPAGENAKRTSAMMKPRGFSPRHAPRKTGRHFLKQLNCLTV
jgi:hypothetical protein